MSLQARVIDYLEKNPNPSMQDVMRNFPDENYSYLAKLKSQHKTNNIPKKVGRPKKRGKKVKKKTSQSLSSSPHGSGGAVSPSTPIPEEIQRIAIYMKYFDQLGLTVKFNEVLSYLDKTQQLNSGSGSELAQQMSTEQLLAVIKPSESLQPAPSPSTSSLADLISPTTRLTSN